MKPLLVLAALLIPVSILTGCAGMTEHDSARDAFLAAMDRDTAAWDRAEEACRAGDCRTLERMQRRLMSTIELYGPPMAPSPYFNSQSAGSDWLFYNTPHGRYTNLGNGWMRGPDGLYIPY